jgi:hypothetical protein
MIIIESEIWCVCATLGSGRFGTRCCGRDLACPRISLRTMRLAHNTYDGGRRFAVNMSVSTQSILNSRRHQLFPILELAEIDRVRRFGEVRSYRAGEALAKVGEISPGLTVILAG